jgi:hypothetical protein
MIDTLSLLARDENLEIVHSTVSQMHRPRPTAPSGLTDYLIAVA